MWSFNSRTGTICENDAVVGYGYSGHAEGRNNPDMEREHNIGPLPRGFYGIVGPPQDTATHGPYVMKLVPEDPSVMFGRSGFLIHGDNVRHDASQGCIILPPQIRHRIWESGDHRLEVVG